MGFLVQLLLLTLSLLATFNVEGSPLLGAGVRRYSFNKLSLDSPLLLESGVRRYKRQATFGRTVPSRSTNPSANTKFTPTPKETSFPSRFSSLILTSILSNNPTALNYALRQGKDPNVVYENGFSPMHYAASVESGATMIELLLRANAKVDVREETKGKTPLMLAVLEGRRRNVGILIKNGANVNAKDEDRGLTVLHHADEPDIAKLLIIAGADVNGRDSFQGTPLHAASARNNASVVEVLLQNGADVHARDKNSVTPLMFTVVSPSYESAELLIQSGADVNIKAEGGISLLSLVKDPNMAQLLIKSGADVNGKDDDSQTPLHYAVIQGNLDLVKLLLRFGADVNARNRHGVSPLHYAVETDDPEPIVEALIDSNADVNSQGGVFNRTILMSAIAKKQLGVTQMLLENGAALDTKDENGLTPMVYAVLQGSDFFGLIFRFKN